MILKNYNILAHSASYISMCYEEFNKVTHIYRINT